MANCYSVTNNQYDVSNINQCLIASQLPIVHKLSKKRFTNECNNGLWLSNTKISIHHSKY